MFKVVWGIWHKRPELLTELKRLAAMGHSAGEIAHELGISRNQVMGKADRENIKLGGGLGILSKDQAQQRAARTAALNKADNNSVPTIRRFTWQADYAPLELDYGPNLRK